MHFYIYVLYLTLDAFSEPNSAEQRSCFFRDANAMRFQFFFFVYRFNMISSKNARHNLLNIRQCHTAISVISRKCYFLPTQLRCPALNEMRYLSNSAARAGSIHLSGIYLSASSPKMFLFRCKAWFTIETVVYISQDNLKWYPSRNLIPGDFTSTFRYSPWQRHDKDWRISQVLLDTSLEI